MELLIPCPHGQTYRDIGLRDGEAEGGRGEDGGRIRMADEVGRRDGDGEESEKSEVRERKE